MDTTDIIRTIVQEFPYALYGSILVGTITAFLGVFIVAKRVVFFGGVLTQISVLGFTLSFLPFFMFGHTVGSLIVTVAGAILLSRLLTGRGIPKDAVLGIVFASAIAIRILIMQRAPRVETSEIESLLRGDILFVTPDSFFPMLGAFLCAVVVYTVFFKEFLYISFDAETARTQGYSAAAWEMLFYGVAGAVITFATHLVGDVFVFGFLVIPPVTAMLLTGRVRRVLLLSTAIGGIAPALGLYLSFMLDFPASPTAIAVSTILLLLAWIFHIIRHR